MISQNKKYHLEGYDLERYLSAEDGYEYWSSVTDKTVLEIGPFDGWYTEIIQQYKPKEHTVIEANKDACDVLQKFTDVKIINDDALFAIDELNEQFDVVILLGVLYHLSSPLHLLERIVNVCQPPIFIIDVPSGIHNEHNRMSIDICDDDCNVPGSRYTSAKTNKTSGIALGLNKVITIKALNNLGYKIITSYEFKNGHKIFKFGE